MFTEIVSVNEHLILAGIKQLNIFFILKNISFLINTAGCLFFKLCQLILVYSLRFPLPFAFLCLSLAK